MACEQIKLGSEDFSLCNCSSHLLFKSTFFFFLTFVLCLVDQQYPAPPPPPPPPMFGCHNPSESCSGSQALLLRNYNRYSRPSLHAIILSFSASLRWQFVTRTRRPPVIFKKRELSLILCRDLISAPPGLTNLIIPEVRCCPLGARRANTNKQWSSAGVSEGRTGDKWGESHSAVRGKLIKQRLQLGPGVCSLQALMLFPACTVTPPDSPQHTHTHRC